MAGKNKLESCIIYGHALDELKKLPDELVQCCVTSPPYYGQRDHKLKPVVWGNDVFHDHKSDLGKEISPYSYCLHLSILFKELMRVLKKDGVLYVNIGDKFAECSLAPNIRKGELIGVPFMFVEVMRINGWILRSEIIWNKTSCRPESVKNRVTRSHEVILMFTRIPSGYYYDADAIREPHKYPGMERKRGRVPGGKGQSSKAASESDSTMKNHPLGRNCWSVWTGPTSNRREKHFSPFPEWIPRRCILSATRKGDIVLDPFVGLGTTAEAARNLERRYIGIDLDSRLKKGHLKLGLVGEGAAKLS